MYQYYTILYTKQMFETKNIRNYVIMFAVVAIASYFGNQIRSSYEHQEKEEEFALIRKYLLNDNANSPFQNNNKPKLWIHTKYAVNARKWKSFYSRNSTDLNQPYIHLTIKTIIQHCGDDFNICLIDDDSFSKLLPSWSVHIDTLAEPFKSRAREFAMTMLLYTFGGMVIPNSFVCTKNLFGLYEEGLQRNLPFVCERVNRLSNFERNHKKMMFVPDTYIMGCRKGDPTMGEFMDFNRIISKPSHFQNQTTFLGDASRWLMTAIDSHKMNLIQGENVGVKTMDRKPILLEELMEEIPLAVDPTAYGIFIPEDDILQRVKYQWFAVLSSEQLMESNAIIITYLKNALRYESSKTNVIYDLEDSIPRKHLSSIA